MSHYVMNMIQKANNSQVNENHLIFSSTEGSSSDINIFYLPDLNRLRKSSIRDRKNELRRLVLLSTKTHNTPAHVDLSVCQFLSTTLKKILTFSSTVAGTNGSNFSGWNRNSKWSGSQISTQSNVKRHFTVTLNESKKARLRRASNSETKISTTIWLLREMIVDHWNEILVSSRSLLVCISKKVYFTRDGSHETWRCRLESFLKKNSRHYYSIVKLVISKLFPKCCT